MVAWHAPNFFEKLNGNIGPYMIRETSSLEWIVRGIQGYQYLFPEEKISWDNYYATGFIKFTKREEKLFNDFIVFHEEHMEEFNELQTVTLRKGFDQTPFNFFCERERIMIQDTSPMFSLAGLEKRNILMNGMFASLGYIWQFNGMPAEARESIINQIWPQIKKRYND